MTDVLSCHAATGVLASFNTAGVLAPSDVHVARRLGWLAGVTDESVLLAAALAVRAPRLGHVCVDLATIAGTASSELEDPVDVRMLPWPDPELWSSSVEASAVVKGAPVRVDGTAAGASPSPVGGKLAGAPLRLEGTVLYLDRYWAAEVQVAAELLARSVAAVAPVDVGVLTAGLARLFPPQAAADAEPDLQRMAAAVAVLRQFAVIAGGPGTGKTTTVARVLALVYEQATASGSRPPLVALAAPTGKAASRLEEAVHAEAATFPVSAEVRDRLLGLRGMTLHRLLGRKPGSSSRFRHDRRNRLAHDVVIVDETSMVSLSLMARLVEAVRSDARLVLVGDPEQLASVEAGAVLGDLVGPAGVGLVMQPAAHKELTTLSGVTVAASPPPSDTPIGDGIVTLRRVHRFGGGIADLAAAIQAGDPDATVGLLAGGDPAVTWLPVDLGAGHPGLPLVREAAVEAGRRVASAARSRDAGAALEALGAFRVLCAHRRGPAGAVTWMEKVRGWLAAEIEDFGAEGEWYAGRPLLVTANDYSLRLFNGDTGVVVVSETGRLAAAFERAGEIIEVSPTRLASVDTVYAMTVHKGQGSQFDAVAVLLPDPDSPILTRELLYTAVTRARERVIVAGTEDSVRTAVGRPIARSSGLGRRLWKDAAVRPGPVTQA